MIVWKVFRTYASAICITITGIREIWRHRYTSGSGVGTARLHMKDVSMLSGPSTAMDV